jgi:hypothetical protein
MFYSQLRRVNLVSLRVGKVHEGNDLLVQNNLVVFNRILELLPIRRLHAAEKFSSNAKIHLAVYALISSIEIDHTKQILSKHHRHGYLMQNLGEEFGQFRPGPSREELNLPQ